MSEDAFGLTTAVAIALGGMIGGGIYAVLGVVTQLAGAATWAAFGLAGLVAACAAYAFAALRRLDEANRGGAVSVVQAFVGNATLAGMTGWTLLVGYVGSMAMYAFAFGEFAVAIEGVPAAVADVPLRPVVSVLAVAAFLGLNLVGARATGLVEAALVGAKVAVLAGLGLGGVAFVLAGGGGGGLSLGVDRLASPDPVMAAAVSFVAFQGWQLLYYDEESVADPRTTIPRAVGAAIATAVAVYVLVAVATFNLAPAALAERPHTALVDAARTLLSGAGLGWLGALAISLSAVASTGSAINATLFSTGHFARRLLADDLLPDGLGDADEAGLPVRTVTALAVVTAALAVVGTLEAITAFASLAFILVFGGVSAVAVSRRHEPGIRPLPPVVGVVGATAFLGLMGWHLATREPGTFWSVLGLAVVVVALELLYFEREAIAAEVEAFEAAVDPAE